MALVDDVVASPLPNATVVTATAPPPVNVEEHDAAVMQRLLRPWQISDGLQTVLGRSILVVVLLGFVLQYFGYSYIVEFDAPAEAGRGGIPMRTPPKFRIGTLEERQFLEEIRRDMKQNE
jgi:hypothetical protein